MKIRTFWPYGIIAAFVLFFAGMVSLVTIAATHREDLVSGNYYQHEIDFQGQIDSAARARQAGAAIRYEAAARQVVVVLPSRQIAEKPAGTVEFYRADAPARDHTLALAPRPDGTQVVDLAGYATGPWLLRASWTAGAQNFYMEQKFIIAAN